MTFDAVVLAGGEARRLGGADKPALSVGGVTLLDRILAACAEAGAASLAVVGPERSTAFDVVWTRESPVGGGPVPALAAGLQVGSAPLVGIFAADLPFMDAAAIQHLLDAIQDAGAETDTALYVDAEGRDQPLAGMYRRNALANAMNQLPNHNGARLRSVLEPLTITRVPDPGGVTTDCDTWERVESVRLLLATSPPTGEDKHHGRTN